jgi:hypothetical protein
LAVSLREVVRLWAVSACRRSGNAAGSGLCQYDERESGGSGSVLDTGSPSTQKRQPTKAAPKSLAGDYVTVVRSGTAAGFTDTNPLRTGINGNGF